MGLTLSHISALDATRLLRSEGADLRSWPDRTPLAHPSRWTGKYWNAKAFDGIDWRWGRPSTRDALHVLVPQKTDRIRTKGIVSHSFKASLGPNSILWINQYSSIVCPELLFVQMANVLSLPALVMLGNELCGSFSRDPLNPIDGVVTRDVPRATSVEELNQFIAPFWGQRKYKPAFEALPYIHDGAVSAPESLLSMLYSLPVSESCYGFGPMELNESVPMDDELLSTKRNRYPDLMFSFAPIGLNYDGEEHLDLNGLVDTTLRAASGDHGDSFDARDTSEAIRNKCEQVRAKAVDDVRRNRELAAYGRIVFPVVKEDLYEEGKLDMLSRQILACAHNVFGVDTHEYERALNDTDLCRDRNELLRSMLPHGGGKRLAHGQI